MPVMCDRAAGSARGRRLPAGVAVILLAVCPPISAADVTGDQVKQAIRKGILYLGSRQLPNGSWPEFGREGGTTALAILALRTAGLPTDDPDIRRGVECLRRVPNEWTYVVAVKIQALAAVDPVKYRQEIQSAANWLVAAQRENGGWGYRLDDSRPDHSNSQFALLGLHEAARAGAKVPENVWRRAEADWVRTQHRDGAWSYVGRGDVGTGSMTTAGVASLHIVGDRLTVGHEHGYTAAGAAPDCGRYSQNRAVARGVEWLGRHFSVRSNPGSGGFYYYYMYGLERVGILLGLRYIGGHDWYREGAAALVPLQSPGGSWREIHDVVDTSFALLFLGKGHRSLLINKLRWSPDDAWNQDRNDIANLIAAIGDKLGEPVSWQVVGVEDRLEEWLSAPILYFNGHTFPSFSVREGKQFAEYVRQGGAVLAEACCSSREFRAGFEAFAARVFPEAPLRRLGPDHPIFHADSEIPAETEVYGIDVGCRTSIVFLPRDVSCLWEQADVPVLSRQAFALGTNIAAYFVGRQKLRDKLDAVHVVKTEAGGAAIPTSALYIAQLMHNGDWRPDPKVLGVLAEFLHGQAGVDVVPQGIPLQPTDEALRRHPIAFMTGHYEFALSPAAVESLRTYLSRGGFLFADACCGRNAFDASFRALAAALFPDGKLESLPPGHPILSGELGFKVDRVRYRPAVTAEQPNLRTPVLEGITREGRTVLVYSPYSIGCPIDGHACHGCRGLEPEDAKRLAANIVLYALSY